MNILQVSIEFSSDQCHGSAWDPIISLVGNRARHDGLFPGRQDGHIRDYQTIGRQEADLQFAEYRVYGYLDQFISSLSSE
jgi:hypothetical protein